MPARPRLSGVLGRLARALGAVAGGGGPAAERREVVLHGLPVVIVNTRPDISTGDVVARLDEALGLIARHTPHYWRHLRRDFAGVVVRREAFRGAYFPESGWCLAELTFVVNRAFTPAQVAATVLHEGMHARLHRLGFPLDFADRPRQERFCRRAEVRFGRVVPGGGPVLERALGILQSAGDAEVAPAIDPGLAAARVAAADGRAAAGALGVVAAAAAAALLAAAPAVAQVAAQAPARPAPQSAAVARSPDGRLVATVRDTPGDSVDAATGPVPRTELWVARADGTGARRLVRGRDATRAGRALVGMTHPAFAPDGRTVYVEAAGWVTSGALHAVDVATGATRFVAPSNGYLVVPRGPLAGHLLVTQHRYFAGGGSYEALTLVSPDGRRTRYVGDADSDAAEDLAADIVAGRVPPTQPFPRRPPGR